MLSNSVAAYIAGFIDADGCLSIRGRDSKGCTQIVFQITNTNKAVLKWISCSLKVGKIYKRKAGNKKCKPVYNLCIFSGEAKLVLPYIEPFLILKRRQANIILNYFKVIKEHNTMNKLRTKKIDLMIKEMRKLNKRGV